MPTTSSQRSNGVDKRAKPSWRRQPPLPAVRHISTVARSTVATRRSKGPYSPHDPPLTGASEIEFVDTQDRAQDTVTHGFAQRECLERNYLQQRVGHNQRAENPSLPPHRCHGSILPCPGPRLANLKKRPPGPRFGSAEGVSGMRGQRHRIYVSDLTKIDTQGGRACVGLLTAAA